MKEYLFYVKYHSFVLGKSVLAVYRCKTLDPLHTYGEMYFRGVGNLGDVIKRIDFVICTPEKLKFWEEEGTEIKTWYNKYPSDYGWKS